MPDDPTEHRVTPENPNRILFFFFVCPNGWGVKVKYRVVGTSLSSAQKRLENSTTKVCASQMPLSHGAHWNELQATNATPTVAGSPRRTHKIALILAYHPDGTRHQLGKKRQPLRLSTPHWLGLPFTSHRLPVPALLAGEDAKGGHLANYGGL